MNDRPTPETDAALVDHMPKDATEWSEHYLALCIHSRKLERERDEAREALNQAACFAAEREHNAMQALAYKAERDEAREVFNLAEDERVDIAQQLSSEKARHAQCQNERDEAREALRMAAQRARVQASAYKLEDLRDNSRWSIFNEGRAQALEKFAEDMEERNKA